MLRKFNKKQTNPLHLTYVYKQSLQISGWRGINKEYLNHLV